MRPEHWERKEAAAHTHTKPAREAEGGDGRRRRKEETEGGDGRRRRQNEGRVEEHREEAVAWMRCGVNQKWPAVCWWRREWRRERRCKWASHGNESGTITF
jgi:hypothetical protein